MREKEIWQQSQCKGILKEKNRGKIEKTSLSEIIKLIDSGKANSICKKLRTKEAKRKTKIKRKKEKEKMKQIKQQQEENMLEQGPSV